MIKTDTFIRIILAMPKVTEQPHFEKTSFRLRKKIFATLDKKNNRACLKFSEVNQNIFSILDPDAIFPVPNKWGNHGWTFIALNKIDLKTCKHALETAYQEVNKKSR